MIIAIFSRSFTKFLKILSSQDPEEEGGPQPKVFFDNFFKGFSQSKQKRGTEDATPNHKSHFFEFISNIVSSIVGGITNLVLTASIGSSGGSSSGSSSGFSKGSADLSSSKS